MSNNLLPPKATPLERAIAQVMERTIEPRISALWNAATCPLDLLPWLAHALGVTEWSESWPEQQRRDSVAAALEIARKRGTVGAVKLAMQVAGFGNAELIEGEGSLTAIQLAACTPGDNCWAYFGLTMPESGTPPTPQSLRTLVRMINQAKPVRSIMNGVWQPQPPESEGVVATEGVATETASEVLWESLVRNLYNGAHDHDGTINYNAQVITEEIVETIRQSFLAQFPASAALSLRQLRFSATRAINVRNDSNVSVDVGFDLNGELDTVALLAHCGSGNGYVTKWYNQATNGASGNFVQATAAQQPRIVTAGVVLTRYGKPMIQMIGNTACLYSEDNTLFQNKSYSRMYLTISRVDLAEYTRSRGIFDCVTTGNGAIDVAFGYGVINWDDLWAAVAGYWPIEVANGGQYPGGISTANLMANWNASASGVSDVVYRTRCTRHSDNLITDHASGITGSANSSNAACSGIYLGRFFGYVADLGTITSDAPQSIGYNELIIYNDATQHGNDADISADIAAYY